MDASFNELNLFSGAATSRDSNGGTTHVTASWVPYHQTLFRDAIIPLVGCEGSPLRRNEGAGGGGGLFPSQQVLPGSSRGGQIMIYR